MQAKPGEWVHAGDVISDKVLVLEIYCSLGWGVLYNKQLCAYLFSVCRFLKYLILICIIIMVYTSMLSIMVHIVGYAMDLWRTTLLLSILIYRYICHGMFRLNMLYINIIHTLKYVRITLKLGLWLWCWGSCACTFRRSCYYY